MSVTCVYCGQTAKRFHIFIAPSNSADGLDFFPLNFRKNFLWFSASVKLNGKGVLSSCLRNSWSLIYKNYAVDTQTDRLKTCKQKKLLVN